MTLPHALEAAERGWVQDLDHLVVAVRDLDAAYAGFALLGFSVTGKVQHPDRGTANHCVLLENGETRIYLELLGVTQPGPANQRLQTVLEASGDTLVGLALRSDDLDALAQNAAPGVVQQRLRLHREDPSAGRAEVDALVLANQGLGMDLLACRHLHPERVWRAPFLSHSNGVARPLGLALRVDRVAEGAERLLAVLPPHGNRQQRASALSPRLSLELLSTSAWQEIYQEAEARLALHLGVTRLETTLAFLRGRGFQLEESERGWRLAPEQASGIWLYFTEL